MTATKVEIVPARRRGVTGYANVGRGTALGNPYKSNGTPEHAAVVTALFLGYWNNPVNDGLHRIARRLLDRDWPGGIVRLACPCNGVEKGQPCHATVIKEFLEAEIERRAQA